MTSTLTTLIKNNSKLDYYLSTITCNYEMESVLQDCDNYAWKIKGGGGNKEEIYNEIVKDYKDLDNFIDYQINTNIITNLLKKIYKLEEYVTESKELIERNKMKKEIVVEAIGEKEENYPVMIYGIKCYEIEDIFMIFNPRIRKYKKRIETDENDIKILKEEIKIIKDKLDKMK